ncbi:VOC family protein [Hymenobacter persicinus]|uniref:Glyoxalase/bleomycin resistance/extradiol dioxygenase family protein n=1 Tax=Hymenobacter persicinus TaxID=2025506 RepID=A0A4Q5LAV5_9BACT|nr:VOC family protein [Hymenobacter persicinus]RYU78116.1 glyoxalase/bleomycin resistance/extradiol dioxygenase family protein [Hymenobacter persicinus]
MATQIFINLPVRDLNASVAFFTQVGFRFNPQFTNEQGACMIISDTIYVMLLVKPFFQSFTTKQVVDATTSAEVILCLSAESRAAVDALVDKALAAGGQQPEVLQPDHDFMYGRNFQDLDGHLWEVMYMDPNFVPQEQPAETNVA